MTHGLPSLLLTIFVAAAARCQSVNIPAGTPLPVNLLQHVPMKVGAALKTELLYPVYEDNQMVLPAKTVIAGEIVGLLRDQPRRNRARLRGDFTPYDKPVVRLTSIVPTGSAPIAIETGEASDGAPIYRLAPTPPVKGGVIGQYFKFAIEHVKDTLRVFTAPDKGDRMLQFIYSQLPYHPQRIPQATAWTVETSAPVTMEPIAAPSEAATAQLPKAGQTQGSANKTNDDERPAWVLKAYLDDAISSETSSADQKIHATIAEPVLNADGSVAVPQGAILSGSVSRAVHAKHFARAGVLRFSFDEITFPGQEAQTVRSTLKAVDSTGKAQLAMDSEGAVKAKPQDKIAVPLLLVLMASRPLDQDHNRNMVGKDAVGSSSLGLISLIVGTAAGVPNFASGLGFYSAALSIYPRWFGKGTAISFPRNTRIVVQTTGVRSSSLKRDAGVPHP